MKTLRTTVLAPGFVALLIATALSQPLHAQSRWLLPRNFDYVVLEVMKPSFDDGGVSFLSSASIITGQINVGSGQTFITVDLPLSHLRVDGGESETALGNPYIGITAFDASNPVIYELGIRIPVASDNSGGITGLVADFDRFEAFATNNFSATASMSYFPSRSGEWVLQTRLGPTFLLSTDPGEFDAAADLYLNYSVISWYFAGRFQGGLGLSGRFLLTDDGSLAERVANQVGFTAQVDVGGAIPGVHIRLPLDDDLADIIDLVFGVNVTVPL